MGAFFKPSEEPGVKRAKRSAATLIPGSSDGTLCAAIAEQMSAVARSRWRKTLSLSPPCGWVHFKLPKWVKSKLALTFCLATMSSKLGSLDVGKQYRRVSSPLSPIFHLFLVPSGNLSLKVQRLLVQDETPDASPPAMGGKRRPGPNRPA